MPRTPRYDLDMILRAFDESDRTYKGVAKRLGCSASNVRHLARKYPQIKKLVILERQKDEIPRQSIFERLISYGNGIREFSRKLEEIQCRALKPYQGYPYAQERKQLDQLLLRLLPPRIRMFEEIMAKLTASEELSQLWAPGGGKPRPREAVNLRTPRGLRQQGQAVCPPGRVT